MNAVRLCSPFTRVEVEKIQHPKFMIMSANNKKKIVMIRLLLCVKHIQSS